MTGILLSTGVSEALVSLIQARQVRVDALEVGPYFSVRHIHSLRRQLPDLPFHFHPGRIPSGNAQNVQAKLAPYLACTSGPWISFHIALVPRGFPTLAYRYGLYLPVRVEWEQRRLVEKVCALGRLVSPISLENMPTPPDARGRYAFEVEPERICRVLDETGAPLLLDLAHARIAAALRCQNPRAYVQELPLERVVQIHISGPRPKNGLLYDAHEAMESEDYDLLEWALSVAHPQIVTLEYFRDPFLHKQQLERLAQILPDQ